jgi:hypothetical protein
VSSISGRSNTNERGSSYDRRARREWVLSPAAPFGGDGEKVPCWECGAMVSAKTMHIDRIIPGEAGGRYVRANIRPHCGPCSCRSGQRRTAEIARARSPYDDSDRCKECGAHFLAAHPPSCALGAAETAWS